MEKSKFSVEFYDCASGWIKLRLQLFTDADRSALAQEMTIYLSAAYEPLPALLAWLEAIVIGVEECGFRIDEEGYLKHFSACASNSGMHQGRRYTVFTVTPYEEGFEAIALQENKPRLQIDLPTSELVAAFYTAFRGFASSEHYVREQWENITYAQIIQEQTGLSIDAWVDSVIHLSKRQLQMALWQFDQSITNNLHHWEIGSEAELLQLSGKTKAEAGGLPQYWMLADEHWGPYAIENEAAKKEDLKESLDEPRYSYGGTPWAKMRSRIIEQWLETEPVRSWDNWKKWLV